MSFSKIIIVGRYQSQQPLTPLSEMKAQQDQLSLFVDLPYSDASRPRGKKWAQNALGSKREPMKKIDQQTKLSLRDKPGGWKALFWKSYKICLRREKESMHGSLFPCIPLHALEKCLS